MIRTFTLCLSLGALGLMGPPADQPGEAEFVEEAVRTLMTGIDQQDAGAIASAFAPDAALFATNPEGDGLVHVDANRFAELHGSGQFGGQPRLVSIDYVDVTDGLVAGATVVASNAAVHYTYYLSLINLDGAWKVQTFLQRSRPA